MIAHNAAAALWLLVPTLPVAFWAAWSDLKFMRLPNIAAGALMIIWVAFGLVALPGSEWLWRSTHLAVVLVLGFALNVAGLVGAGDAKFAAAMAPFVALADAALFLPLFSAVLLAGFAAHRMLKHLPAFRRRTADWASWERREFPMGLALAGALVFYLALAAALGT